MIIQNYTIRLLAFLVMLFFQAMDACASDLVWPNGGFQRRLVLTFGKTEKDINALPVSIDIGKHLSGDKGNRFAFSSLRVFGPNGDEIPCQIVEYDGGETVSTNPNHIPEPGDLLVFQVDIPSSRTISCQLAWKLEPTALPKYKTTLSVHECVYVKSLKGDAMLHSPNAMVVFRGATRKTAPYPVRNANVIPAVVSYLDLNRYFVAGGYGAQYFPIIKWPVDLSTGTWSLPKVIECGPVRVAVQSFMDTKLMKLSRSVSLYERGAWVLFKERVDISKESKSLTVQESLPVCFDADTTGFYVKKGITCSWTPSEKSKDGKVAMRFQESVDMPWFATWNSKRSRGVVVFLRECKEEKTGFRGRMRLDPSSAGAASLSFARTVPSGRSDHMIFIQGFRTIKDIESSLAACRLLNSTPWEIGDIEKREVEHE